MSEPTPPNTQPQVPLTLAAPPAGGRPVRNGPSGTRIGLTIYGAIIGVLGLVILFGAPASNWIGLIPIFYGLYLIIPGGRKWVIY